LQSNLGTSECEEHPFICKQNLTEPPEGVGRSNSLDSPFPDRILPNIEKAEILGDFSRFSEIWSMTRNFANSEEFSEIPRKLPKIPENRVKYPKISLFNISKE